LDLKEAQKRLEETIRQAAADYERAVADATREFESSLLQFAAEVQGQISGHSEAADHSDQ
jgi:hypothetical protein